MHGVCDWIGGGVGALDVFWWWLCGGHAWLGEGLKAFDGLGVLKFLGRRDGWSINLTSEFQASLGSMGWSGRVRSSGVAPWFDPVPWLKTSR